MIEFNCSVDYTGSFEIGIDAVMVMKFILLYLLINLFIFLDVWSLGLRVDSAPSVKGAGAISNVQEPVQSLVVCFPRRATSGGNRHKSI